MSSPAVIDRPAAARTAVAADSPWKPMKDAPKGHLILVKLSAGMERKEIAVTAQYHPDHGGFATPKLGVWAPTVIDGMGWMEIPGLARVDAVHGLEGPHG